MDLIKLEGNNDYSIDAFFSDLSGLFDNETDLGRKKKKKKRKKKKKKRKVAKKKKVFVSKITLNQMISMFRNAPNTKTINALKKKYKKYFSEKKKGNKKYYYFKNANGTSSLFRYRIQSGRKYTYYILNPATGRFEIEKLGKKKKKKKKSVWSKIKKKAKKIKKIKKVTKKINKIAKKTLPKKVYKVAKLVSKVHDPRQVIKIAKKIKPKKILKVAKKVTKVAMKSAKIAAPMIATSLGIPPAAVNAGLTLATALSKGKIDKSTFKKMTKGLVKDIGGKNLQNILKAKKMIDNPSKLLKIVSKDPKLKALQNNYVSEYKKVKKMATKKITIKVIDSVESQESAAIKLYDRELIR